MDRFQGGKACWFEGHELSVWKKGIYPTTEMIHRGDAQMNSYRYDRTTSAEDTPEMYRSLLVCTGLMWVAGCRAFEKIDVIRYKFQAQPFNHIRDISWPKSMNISSQGSIVGAEVSNDMMIDFTATATEKMRLLQLWVNIRFILILHSGEKGNKLRCLRNFVHEWLMLVWYLQVWFDVLSHIQGTMPPLYLMQRYAKYCYLHCFLILIDHVACESIQMLKTEKRRKKQGSYTRTGLLAHPGILYVLQLGREDSKCFAVSTKASPRMDKSGLSW